MLSNGKANIMYTPATVAACLKPTVQLSDAAIYAQTYLNTAVIATSIPDTSDQATVLDAILTGSVTKLMGDVIRIKKVTNNVKSVLDDFSLFDGRADFDQKNSNKGRFVGLMLNMVNNSDIGLNIFRLAFQADMPCPDMKIYLFNSEQSEPIPYTDGSITTDYIPFNYTAGRNQQWIDINLPLVSNEGIYYLGYFETDLAAGAQSLKKTLDFVNQPTCTTCNQNYYTQYMKRVKYLNIQPFYVDINNLNGEELFDTNKINYVDFNNWGLNLKITVACDISEFVCRNKALFYDALSMRYCIDILDYILLNVRNNSTLEKVKDGIIFLRDGDKTNGSLGLSHKYEEIIEALNVDLSGFNALCLPCVKNAYVKRKYIG